MESSQALVGTIIRLPGELPGLIQADGRQLPFHAGPTWTSPQPPALNQRVRIVLDEAGGIASLTPVEGSAALQNLQGAAAPVLASGKAWLERQRAAGRLPWLIGGAAVVLVLIVFFGQGGSSSVARATVWQDIESKWSRCGGVWTTAIQESVRDRSRAIRFAEGVQKFVQVQNLDFRLERLEVDESDRLNGVEERWRVEFGDSSQRECDLEYGRCQWTSWRSFSGNSGHVGKVNGRWDVSIPSMAGYLSRSVSFGGGYVSEFTAPQCSDIPR